MVATLVATRKSGYGSWMTTRKYQPSIHTLHSTARPPAPGVSVALVHIPTTSKLPFVLCLAAMSP